MIVSSTFEIGPTQVDGRFYVNELHTAEDGQTYPYEYLCDPQQTDPQVVLETRVAFINDILAKRENARLLVAGTSVPLTRFEFLDRFTPVERVAIRARRATDGMVDDYMAMMELSANVSLVRARPGLFYLASLGILTMARAQEIGAE